VINKIYSILKILIFLFIFFIASLYCFEFLLSKLDSISNPHITSKNLDINKRFINFREHPLNLNKSFSASRFQLKDNPSLEGKKFIYKTDENGFLLPGNRYENSDLRIFFLGGSTTENLMVKDTNRFTFLVQNYLEDYKKKKINVYNSGRSKNNSIHSFNILLNKVLNLNPTHVFLMHNVNDYYSLLVQKENSLFNLSSDVERNQITEVIKEKEISYLKLRSFFFSNFPNIAIRVSALNQKYFLSDINKENDPYTNISTQDVEIFFKEKINILKLYHQLSLIFKFELILITQPHNYEIKKNDIFWERFNLNTKIHDRTNNLLREFANLNQLKFVDLAFYMNNKNEYFYDEIHYNDNGSKFVAKKIFETMKNDVR